eukprot:351159-Chlamydomonas_euryale.AAC.2
MSAHRGCRGGDACQQVHALVLSRHRAPPAPRWHPHAAAAAPVDAVRRSAGTQVAAPTRAASAPRCAAAAPAMKPGVPAGRAVPLPALLRLMPRVRPPRAAPSPAAAAGPDSAACAQSRPRRRRLSACPAGGSLRRSGGRPASRTPTPAAAPVSCGHCRHHGAPQPLGLPLPRPPAACQEGPNPGCQATPAAVPCGCRPHPRCQLLTAAAVAVDPLEGIRRVLGSCPKSRLCLGGHAAPHPPGAADAAGGNAAAAVRRGATRRSAATCAAAARPAARKIARRLVAAAPAALRGGRAGTASPPPPPTSHTHMSTGRGGGGAQVPGPASSLCTATSLATCNKNASGDVDSAAEPRASVRANAAPLSCGPACRPGRVHGRPDVLTAPHSMRPPDSYEASTASASARTAAPRAGPRAHPASSPSARRRAATCTCTGYMGGRPDRYTRAAASTARALLDSENLNGRSAHRARWRAAAASGDAHAAAVAAPLSPWCRPRLPPSPALQLSLSAPMRPNKRAWAAVAPDGPPVPCWRSWLPQLSCCPGSSSGREAASAAGTGGLHSSANESSHESCSAPHTSPHTCATPRATSGAALSCCSSRRRLPAARARRRQSRNTCCSCCRPLAAHASSSGCGVSAAACSLPAPPAALGCVWGPTHGSGRRALVTAARAARGPMCGTTGATTSASSWNSGARWRAPALPPPPSPRCVTPPPQRAA